MKIKQLLILGGVLLSSITANAEIIDGVRQRPNVVKTEAFQIDAVYYLFNTEARMFFVGGNDWNTRASVGTKGYKVKIVQSDFASDGSFEFTDSVETKKAWLSVFSTDDAGAIWVDNSDATYRFWEFTEKDGKYRISNSELAIVADAANDKFLGWNGTGDTRLYFVDPATPGVGVDWVFVTEETYKTWLEAWEPMKDQFSAAEELLTYLKSAKEQNINVEAEQAVYNNEAATVEELKAATLSVQKKISDALGGDATVDNPADMTGSLMNPNFDGHSAEGWKGDQPGFGNNPHPAAEVAEFYGKDKYNVYQDLKGLPAGVYKLTANAYNRGAWEGHAEKKDYVVYLYAQADNDTVTSTVMNAWDAMNTKALAGETSFGTTATQEEQTHDGVTYYIPSDPSAARVAFERGLYLNDLYFMVEEGSVRVGIRKDKKIFDWDWECMDNFKLTYFGKAAEAYDLYMENAVTKKEYTGVNVSEQYLTKYAEAFNTPVTNKTEVKAALAVISAAEDSIAENVKLWKALKNTYDEGIQKCADFDYTSAAGKLGDYLMEVVDATDITELEQGTKEDDYDLSNQALQAMIDQINKLMDDVDTELKDLVKPGADVTMFIKNADFEKCEKDDNGNNIDNQASDWIVEKVKQDDYSNVLRGGTSDNHCFEAWHHKNFDIYQEIKNLPIGLYEVTVKGYVRYLDGQDAITKAEEAPEEIAINLYINDVKTKFNNWLSNPQPASFYEGVAKVGDGILDDGNDNCYPDNLASASHAFANGGYEQKVKCFVAKEGSVTRIGVKGNLDKALYWVVFDDFQMKYIGANADDLKPILQEKIEEAKQWESEMTTKSAKTMFTNAMTAANEAVNGDDAQAILTAVDNLIKAINEVKDGSQLCKPVQEKVVALVAFATESDSPLASEALTLAGTIQSGLEECAYDEEDLKAKSLEMKEMTLRMMLPADYTESSAEGKDVTAFIQTPSFEKKVNGEKTNSIDGWLGTDGYNFGNHKDGEADQRTALALEFYQKKFDMYQDLAGVGSVVLPKGNYRLQVNAFERVNEASPAYLYAVAGNDSTKVEIMKHEAGFDAEAGETGPGDMLSSVEMFKEGKYLNQICFNFQSDTLRIGIMHKESNGGDWVIMDNFKLFYHGTDNTGVETVINLGKPVQVLYFTLDGRQVSAARKGLVIRKTIMDNGTTVVRKIQK